MKNAAKTIIKQHVLGDDRDKERVIEKLDKAKEERNKGDQGAVSITDPESRFMQNKRGRKELSYNPQISVDSDSGIIAANGVTQDCTDHYQLQPQVEMVEENLGELPDWTKMCNVNGYFTSPNLRYLEKKGLNGYIPDSKQAQKHKGKKVVDSPYTKDKFEYDEANDQFICPNGDVLVRKGEYMVKGKLQYSYSGANCSECPFQAECAGKGKKKENHERGL